MTRRRRRRGALVGAAAIVALLCCTGGVTYVAGQAADAAIVADAAPASQKQQQQQQEESNVLHAASQAAQQQQQQGAEQLPPQPAHDHLPAADDGEGHSSASSDSDSESSWRPSEMLHNLFQRVSTLLSPASYRSGRRHGAFHVVSSSDGSSSGAASLSLEQLASKRKEEEEKDVRFVVGLYNRAPQLPSPLPEGSHTVVMTAKNGQRFRCLIPHPSSEDNLALPDPRTVLPEVLLHPSIAQQQMHEQLHAHMQQQSAAGSSGGLGSTAKSVSTLPPSAPTEPAVPDSVMVPKLIHAHLGTGCFTRQVDYWTYEVCPFRRVRQYHRASDTNSVTLDFSLGSYTALGDMVAKAGVARADAKGEPLLYTQLFEGGTNNRRSLVRFLCNTGSTASPSTNTAHLLMDVREPRPHHYEFDVRTTLMCRDSKGKLGGPIVEAADAAAAAEHAATAKRAAGAPQAGALPGETLLKESSETGRLYTAPSRRKKLSASGSAPSSTSSSSPSSSSSSVPHVLDLLEPLGNECLLLNTGWWTYKFCYLREITQFHRESIAVSATILAAEGATVQPAAAGGAAAGGANGPPAPVPVKLGARSAEEAAANIREANAINAANQAAWAAQQAAGGKGAAAATPASSAQTTKVVTTAEYVLGLLPSSLTLSELESVTHVVEGASWEDSYVSHTYHSGTTCDLNGRPRITESRIYCDPASAAAGASSPFGVSGGSAASPVSVLKSVVEAATCQYIVTIHSPLLCTHPAFKPHVPRVHEIACEPIQEDGTPDDLRHLQQNILSPFAQLFQP